VSSRPPFPRRRSIVALTVGIGAVFAAGPLSTTAQASSTPSLSTFDSRLLHYINDARAARGIRRLTPVAGTTDIAHHWSCHLASSSTLSHDLNLSSALMTHGSKLWTTYGENVGMQSSGYTALHLFRKYMGDPVHKANLLDPSFRYVGVWTKRHYTRRWNTLDFVGSPVSSYSTTYGGTRVTC
jgi:uncharacterized protein YkwD